MPELNLYNIDDDYIKYLQNEEKSIRGFTKVSNNFSEIYKNKKPYVGIILKINKFNYFVPLTHPKEHYEENASFFNRISEPIKLKNQRDYGRLMFCYMIPLYNQIIPEPIKINETKDLKYKSVLMTQYFYINSREAQAKILDKANKLYNKVSNTSHHLYQFCCDFKLLENACMNRSFNNLSIELKKEYNASSPCILKRKIDYTNIVKANNYAKIGSNIDLTNKGIQNIEIFVEDDFGKRKYVNTFVKIDEKEFKKDLTFG